MSFYLHHYYLTAHVPDYFSADVYNVSAAKKLETLQSFELFEVNQDFLAYDV